MSQDVLEEGRDKRRMSVCNPSNLRLDLYLPQFRGIYAAVTTFIMFSMIQFRDGPFIRPHPAFWRMVLGINLLYELSLVFLLFQDLSTAQHMMTYIDPSLGRPLPEKSYAEDCSLSASTIWVSRVYESDALCS